MLCWRACVSFFLSQAVGVASTLVGVVFGSGSQSLNPNFVHPASVRFPRVDNLPAGAARGHAPQRTCCSPGRGCRPPEPGCSSAPAGVADKLNKNGGIVVRPYLFIGYIVNFLIEAAYILCGSSNRSTARNLVYRCPK